MYIGHIKINERGEFELQELNNHLGGTAKLAESFASQFQNAEWGKLLGLWHDVGKYSDEFQEYIKKNSGYEEGERLGKTDHTSAAAILAKKYIPVFGLLWLIALLVIMPVCIIGCLNRVFQEICRTD